MRLPLILLVPLLLSGCFVGGDYVRNDELVAGQDGTFVYAVRTNTVMTPNDDGSAELIRLDWLKETIEAQSLCPNGYKVLNRDFVVEANGPFRAASDIVYKGECLNPGASRGG